MSARPIAVVTGGPRLGDAEAGGAAALGGAQFAVWSGGLACVAGSLFIAAVLGYYGASGRLDLRGDKPAILLEPLLAGRLAAIALIACVAAYVNLRRDAKAVSAFVKGVLWALP